MKNKLAYLGFLGLLGFAGFFGEPLLFFFFANFTFFQYIKTVPDELFWANVRMCATHAFFIFIIAGNFIVVTSLLLLANDNFYRYGPIVMIGGFALTMAISDFVFIANLAYLEKKEMKSKDENNS